MSVATASSTLTEYNYDKKKFACQTKDIKPYHYYDLETEMETPSQFYDSKRQTLLPPEKAIVMNMKNELWSNFFWGLCWPIHALGYRIIPHGVMFYHTKMNKD